ncbi:sarcosine oxidase subunit delta family protein [bacterium]|nr:sarcosine oxidase subunit delta family protein [bacterium]
MLLIHCPHCGEGREEEEFRYSGEAHIVRPRAPQDLNDQEWGDYLFFRKNPRGIHHEMWYHAVGCRRYFYATRDTLSYEILETYIVGEKPQVTSAGSGQ